MYAAVNALGAVAIAGFFQGLAAGSPNFDAYTLGSVLKVTLVPMLGVLAYRDLLDRVPAWARIPSWEIALRAAAAEPAGNPPIVSPPPPPAEETTSLPLPPPPED